MIFITIGMSKLTFITLNCRGLRTADDRATLFQWGNCAKTYFMWLHETHSISEEEFLSWLDYAISSGSNKFGYKWISSPGTILSCEVAILYNPGYDVVSFSRDQDGRLLCVEFSKDGNLIQLVNIYAPSYAKPASAFFESLYQLLDPDGAVRRFQYCGESDQRPFWMQLWNTLGVKLVNDFASFNVHVWFVRCMA